MSKSAWEGVIKLLREGREKSVGVFYILPKTDSEVQTAHDETVKEALDLLEREGGIGRAVLRDKK